MRGRASGNAARAARLELLEMIRFGKHAVIWRLVALALLAASPAAENRRDEPARVQAESHTEAAVPFQVGERLDYRVGWASFLIAATSELRVVERRPFHGRIAWHFQARAQTVEPVRYLYPLDNQFDSYTDAVSLAGLQYESRVREGDKREDSVVRMSTDGEPAAEDVPTARVPAGTRDPLGAFYLLRATDWGQTWEVRTPVYDGKKLYEMRARHIASEEEVSVPAGEYAATKIEVRLFERGRELSQTRFWVWLAEDRARTPVLLAAELPFGSLRVELTRAPKD